MRLGFPDLIERMESVSLSYGDDIDALHKVLKSGLGSFIDMDADIDSLSINALRKEREHGLQRRLMALVVDEPEAPRPVCRTAVCRPIEL